MSATESLFAQKLRQHRLERGTHGRMTQEQLAEEIGVSVDAIGKYERSLSFIRGDLEHRLVERLGWSQDAVLACREEWEGRRARPDLGYRILDWRLMKQLFGGSVAAASDAAIEYSLEQFGNLPSELSVDCGVFEGINEAFPESWTGVLQDGRFVAKLSVLTLEPELEVAFMEGRLMENELDVDKIRRPILPGSYFAYCPALIISPGHERAAGLLLSSFVARLEDYARREILLHGIGSITTSAGGVQISRDLGMERLGDHVLGPQFGVWVMTGAGIARSIFARKSALVRDAYSRAFL